MAYRGYFCKFGIEAKNDTKTNRCVIAQNATRDIDIRNAERIYIQRRRDNLMSVAKRIIRTTFDYSFMHMISVGCQLDVSSHGRRVLVINIHELKHIRMRVFGIEFVECNLRVSCKTPSIAQTIDCAVHI